MSPSERSVPDVRTLSGETPGHPVGEATFHRLAEALPQLVWTARPDGHRDSFNQRWYDYTGSSPAASEGEGWRLSVHPDDLTGVSHRWGQALRTGGSYEAEYRCRRQDGVYRWFLDRAHPVREGGGPVVKWFGTSTDIDELKRAEERFRSLVNATSQVVWATRSDGEVVEESPSWQAFTGQPREEYQGFGWLAAIHPEDQERVRRGWEAARAIKQSYEVEMRLRRPDGSYSVTLSRSVPLLDSQGRVREWMGTTTDITLQRQAEEASRRLESEQRARRLEALRAEVSEVLSREDTLARLMQACAEALVQHLRMLPLVQLWTWSREARVLLLEGNAGPVAPFSTQPSRLELGQFLAGAVGQSREPLLMQEDPRLYSLPWAQAHGLVSFLGTPLLVRGQLVGVLSVFGQHPLEEETLASLTTMADGIAQGLERRRAELALQAHARELARSNEELRQFVHVASYDLQEPLRGVASYTQLLARRYRDKLDSDAEELITRAVDGVNQMQRLIHDLLAYSRVGTRGHELKPIESGLALDKALANLKTLVEETGALLVRGRLPRVMADETQLIELFQNLVGNALKFHGQAPPRVVVEVECQGDEWRFTVEDNGIGIEPRYFERIFGIFQRLHGEEYPGTGIGLAICKKIVERHGGRIGFESRAGQGTTFWFTLSAVPTPSPQGLWHPQ